MATITYSPRDIYEHEFKVSLRGFDREEVDEFLDNVIQDYELFLAEIQQLKAENEKLKAKVKELETRVVTPDIPVTPQAEVPVSAPGSAYGAPASPGPNGVTLNVADNTEQSQPVAISNVDILRRISRLELEVFGKKIEN